MKSYSVTRTAVGAGLVASLMLMQGCSYFGGDKKPEDPPVIPDPGTTTVITDPPVEITPVKSTTSYTIAKGDTISEVALRYGLRWQDVLAVNPGVSPKKLRVGQVIQLPGQVDVSKSVPVRKATTPKFTAPKTSAPKSVKGPTGPGTAYVVKSGDTLGGIAYRHGVKVDAIRKANNMTSDKISINQKLTIPGATKKPAGDAKVSEKKDPVAVELPKVTPVDVPPISSVTPPPVDTNATIAPPDATTTSVVTPPVTPAANAQTYTVKEGEDLYAVAIRWGVSPSDLKALNNLTSTDLKAGMVLQIPASAQ